MAVQRLDNVGIVVEDLGTAIEFFRELGLELESDPPSKANGSDGLPDWATSTSRSP
ncbi:hypothetical protein [Deinococcus koreensis]|uniref:hypothetical protein n=1 Tax=Deinococcus koreensis TaxID=2054903 RepID=UPI001A9FEAB1|nr:hypothetical protein [Deinococcus koreensis]